MTKENQQAWQYDKTINAIPQRFRRGQGRNRFRKQFGGCFICEKPLDDTTNRDHFIPRSEGGHGSWANCVLTHQRCNEMKADSIPTIPFLVKFKLVTGRWPMLSSGGLSLVYSKIEIEAAVKIYERIRSKKAGESTNIIGRSL